MWAKHLTPRALVGLKNYQYKSGGYTFLDDIHTPVWNWMVTLLPRWLAPNLITMIGLLCLVAAYAANAYYAVDYVGIAPRWAYLLSGLSVIAYVNLDSLDGKQARRTKSSSPLGQLFDHGCDAFSVHLLLANIGCSMQVPCGWQNSYGTIGVMLTWMLGQFEEYHTTTMSYGNGVFGIMEANYSLATIHFLTWWYGPEMWSKTYTLPIPGLAEPITSTIRSSLLLAVFSSAIIQSIGQLKRGLSKVELTPQERGNKGLGGAAAVQQLSVLGLLLLLGGLWQAVPVPASAVGQCRAVSAAFGIVYAMVAGQLIMSHMCKEPFVPSAWAYVVLAVGLVNAHYGFVDQQLASFGLCGVVLLAYLHYVTSVVRQICDFLGIACFTIKPSKDS